MDKKEKKVGQSSRLKLFSFRYYKVITAIIVLLIVVSSYYFVLQPKYNEVSIGGRYNLSSLQEDLSNRQNYLTQLQNLNNNFDKISAQEKIKLEKILPRESDVPGLLVQLESLALDNDLLLEGVTFNEVPRITQTNSRRSNRGVVVEEEEANPLDNIDKVVVNLNLRSLSGGSYAKVKEFVENLESNLRIFDVSAVFFTPDSPSFSISLVTYYLN